MRQGLKYSRLLLLVKTQRTFHFMTLSNQNVRTTYPKIEENYPELDVLHKGAIFAYMNKVWLLRVWLFAR